MPVFSDHLLQSEPFSMFSEVPQKTVQEAPYFSPLAKGKILRFPDTEFEK